MHRATKHPFKTPPMRLDRLAEVNAIQDPRRRREMLERNVSRVVDGLRDSAVPYAALQATGAKFPELKGDALKNKTRDEMFMVLASWASAFEPGSKDQAYVAACSMFLDNSRVCRRIGIL